MNKNSNSNKNQYVDSTDMEIDDYLKKIMVTPLENKIDNFSEKIEEEFSEIENAVDALPTAGAIEGHVKDSIERLLEQQLEELKINDNFDKLNGNQEEIKAFLSDSLIPFLEEFRTSVDVDIKEIKGKIDRIENEMAKSKKEFPLYKTISLVVNFSLLGIGIFFIFLHFFH